ncbi:MAG TPA: 5-methyltetrahydropteroyltriglutamate--homocysteine S-methyltransferase [Clostridiales bacterium]|nr:5-methyltetrahydropteroyltriglutamate--homocysteine S-methyltransferase [Clostridiales bacterium]
MQKISVVGYPRIGIRRELKKWVEGYFKGKISKEQLLKNSAKLRVQQWLLQKDKGIDFIPSNDFSFYDMFLDTACLLGVVPERYRELGLDYLDTYFAMAKGFQAGSRDVKALPMKKWFNTNYHYLVPSISDPTNFQLSSSKPLDEYAEALRSGVKTKPVIIGPLTFLKLSNITEKEKMYFDYADSILRVYKQLLFKFNELGIELVQIDEPVLVTDLSYEDISCFTAMYKSILTEKGNVKILLQTYFGDIRDIYNEIMFLDFDAVGLDFVEGEKNIDLIEEYGFPKNKLLFAGVVNGKNIWINNHRKTLEKLNLLEKHINKGSIVLSTSCSLLHVPYTIKNETLLEERYIKQFAFAEEKLEELKELSELWDLDYYTLNKKYVKNVLNVIEKHESKEFFDEIVREDVASLIEDDFIRYPVFEERIKIQKERFKLPLLPTTTIGSFPQTVEVRELRKKYKNGEITLEQYNEKIKYKIAEAVQIQEEVGLDVLVHGEYERNDMVEYFGENLSGFLFTQNGWVQSYGTRGVKPPIIFGDVKWVKPITSEYIMYAQSLTDKSVKGMLTGPVTILNWSFPREDLPLREIAYQIALAIRQEVKDLEAKGIKIIQIDEAALREKLPLRKEDWHNEYLDWAIKAFRLVHAHAKPQTQIHTHMCYSEFKDIIKEIEEMDVDVITFEAAKSDLSLLDILKESNFRPEVGPGVYDIHSPRVPDIDEIKEIILKMISRLNIEKVWINPDCGLKTRGMDETTTSLKNMVAAVEDIRKEIKYLQNK